MKKSTLSAITILMLTVGLLTGDARSETAKAAPAILECIPAGSSYYMTNSISKTIDAAEMFLIDIGVGEMMGIGVSRPGDGRQRDSMLLMMLKQSLQLGEGFDPKGAAAVVILDPKVAGVDLVGELKPEKFDRLCAFVVPGTLKNLFVNVEVTTEGRLTVSQMFGEKAYAAQKGSYVVLAPTKTAINAILDSKKTAAAELSADELALIKNSEVTIHYAVGPFRPLFGKFLDLADKKLKSDFDKATAAGLRLYVTMARGYIEQIDAITAGVKLGQNGVNIDSITVAKSGSTAAKIFKAESTNIGGAKVLDCLPSLPYVAAMGMNGWLDNPTLYGALTDMSMAMMGPDSLYKMDEKDKAQMLEWNKEMAGMVTGMQMVIGGAPKGKGMGSLSYVIKCKDSAKYRAMLPKGIEMSNKMIGSEEATPGVPKMSMTYTKDAVKAGKLSIDAIDVVMKDVSDDEMGQISAIFKMALGEDNIRVLIATPDAKTMVVTIGGSIDAMKETIKVASGTGPIPTAPGTALALRHLPKNSSIIMLLNAGNLMDVIRAGMETAGQQPEVVGMAPTIKCKTPIAFGMKAKGSTLHTGLFVSKPLIKDIFLAVMKTIARKQQNTKPAPPPDDF